MSTTDVGELNVLVVLEDEDAAELVPAAEDVLAEIEPDDLENLESGFKVYDVRAETVLKKIAGIVGFDANITRTGLIQETKKYTLRTEPDKPGFEQLYGVSVRLLVAATDWDSKVKVTVPSVAASAELGFRNAQVNIQVRGYHGDLGSMLPSPSALNVTSYAKYIAAFDKIQKKVMSDEEHQHPVLLEERPVGHKDDTG